MGNFTLTSLNSGLLLGIAAQSRAIDLRDVHDAAASWRPFNRDVIAAHGTHIKITFQRIGPNHLAGPLAHLTKRHERPADVCAKFFLELAPRGGFRVLCTVHFAFRNRPGAKIAVAPKRAARMDEESDDAGVASTVH